MSWPRELLHHHEHRFSVLLGKIRLVSFLVYCSGGAGMETFAKYGND